MFSFWEDQEDSDAPKNVSFDYCMHKLLGFKFQL
jgi:hypothetical protein